MPDYDRPPRRPRDTETDRGTGTNSPETRRPPSPSPFDRPAIPGPTFTGQTRAPYRPGYAPVEGPTASDTPFLDNALNRSGEEQTRPPFLPNRQPGHDESQATDRLGLFPFEGWVDEAANAEMERAEARANLDPSVINALDILDEAAGDVRSADADSDARDDSVITGTQAFAAVMSTLPPDQQAAVLEHGGPAVRTFLSNMEHLSPDETTAVFGNLSAAAEFMGRDEVDALAEMLASDMSVDRGELFAAVEQTVEDGNGATLAMSLAHEVQESDPHMASALVMQAEDGINNVRGDYEESLGEYQSRTNELSNLVGTWQQSGLDEESIASLVDGYREEHSEVFSDFESQSARFASTIEGSAYALDNFTDDEFYHFDRDNHHDTLYLSHTLQMSEAGQQALADTVLQAGRDDRRNWLDTAETMEEHYNQRAENEADGNRFVDFSTQLDSAIATGANVGIQTTAASGDAQGALDVIAGLEAHETDPTMIAALAEARGEVERLFEDYNAGVIDNPEEFLTGLNTAFVTAGRQHFGENIEGLDRVDQRHVRRLGQIGAGLTLGASVIALGDGVQAHEPFKLGAAAAGVYTNFSSLDEIAGIGDQATSLADNTRRLDWSDLTRRGQIGVIGSGANAAAGVTQLFDGNNSAGEVLRTALDVGDFGSDVAAILGRNAGKQLLARVGLVTTLAFSAWDTVSAIQDGDWVGAAAAASPLVGAAIGAALTSWSGPGAILGAAIGMLVGFGIQFARWLFSDSPEEIYENNTDEALMRMFEHLDMDEETSARMAERLRNVNGDFVGVGPALGELATQMNLSTEELLVQLSELPDGQLERVANQILGIDHNQSDIEDARRDYFERKTDDPDSIPAFAFTNDEEMQAAIASLEANGIEPGQPMGPYLPEVSAPADFWTPGLTFGTEGS